MPKKKKTPTKNNEPPKLIELHYALRRSLNSLAEVRSILSEDEQNLKIDRDAATVSRKVERGTRTQVVRFEDILSILQIASLLPKIRLAAYAMFTAPDRGTKGVSNGIRRFANWHHMVADDTLNTCNLLTSVLGAFAYPFDGKRGNSKFLFDDDWEDRETLEKGFKNLLSVDMIGFLRSLVRGEDGIPYETYVIERIRDELVIELSNVKDEMADVPMLGSKPNDSDESTGEYRRFSREEAVAKALILLKEDPNRPQEEIAKQIGRHSSFLSRSPEFQALRTIIASERTPRYGFRKPKADGSGTDLEAIDDFDELDE